MERYPEIEECAGVYPPREDSYLLFDAIEIHGGERFLEIGTGTGFIGIGAALSGAEVFATDIDPEAIVCARKNAEKNGVYVEFILTDMFRGIRGSFDVIAFNPPYLPESHVEYGRIKGAIESPYHGSYHVRRFVFEVGDFLREGGRAYFVASSLTDMGDIEDKFIKIAEKPLFFEKIYVFMFSHKKGL